MANEYRKQNYNPALLNRRQIYEYIIKQVSKVKQELRTANVEESVNTALNKLANLMDELSKDSQIAELKDLTIDISATIRGVKLHDITRASLDEMLQKLLNVSESIVLEEKKKENAGKLKALLLEMAAHSEEIANVIDLDQIFKIFG